MTPELPTPRMVLSEATSMGVRAALYQVPVIAGTLPQLLWMIFWQDDPVPQLAQAVPDSVPSDYVKSKTLFRTMTRGLASVRYAFS